MKISDPDEIDPEREGSVSADEEEDTVPDRLAFDLMAETLRLETMRTPAVPCSADC